jgi:hypothetical protein
LTVSKASVTVSPIPLRLFGWAHGGSRCAARLRSPANGTPLFALDSAVSRTQGEAEIKVPVLQPGAKLAAKDEPAVPDASCKFTMDTA